MASSNMDLAQVGALGGDSAHANILSALLDGRALTPSELADIVGVTLPTTSEHLTSLTQANLPNGKAGNVVSASPLKSGSVESLKVSNRCGLQAEGGPYPLYCRD
jgi:hypothetical protein